MELLYNNLKCAFNYISKKNTQNNVNIEKSLLKLKGKVYKFFLGAIGISLIDLGILLFLISLGTIIVCVAYNTKTFHLLKQSSNICNGMNAFFECSLGFIFLGLGITALTKAKKLIKSYYHAPQESWE